MDQEPLVLHRTDSLWVVSKPAGMLVHPVTPEGGGTLAEWIAECEPGPVHLVGRLDRDTSGLVLVARRPEVHRYFARHPPERRYLALVRGHPPDAGIVDAPIGRDRDDPPLRAVRPEGQPARTRFRTLHRLRDAALVELVLDTGRTHQIRVHMMHLGHPVLGDRWYGRAGLELIGRQALHAARLAFTDPDTGAPITVECPLPPDMAVLLESLA
ncbi:MAG TPA: RluA family pseudouridine synthase [Longimicrobium sp.]|jgi:23S rRNA pseudouridine1911/1915/1917 synthase